MGSRFWMAIVALTLITASCGRGDSGVTSPAGALEPGSTAELSPGAQSLVAAESDWRTPPDPAAVDAAAADLARSCLADHGFPTSESPFPAGYFTAGAALPTNDWSLGFAQQYGYGFIPDIDLLAPVLLGFTSSTSENTMDSTGEVIPPAGLTSSDLGQWQEAVDQCTSAAGDPLPQVPLPGGDREAELRSRTLALEDGFLRTAPEDLMANWRSCMGDLTRYGDSPDSISRHFADQLGALAVQVEDTINSLAAGSGSSPDGEASPEGIMAVLNAGSWHDQVPGLDAAIAEEIEVAVRDRTCWETEVAPSYRDDRVDQLNALADEYSDVLGAIGETKG